MMTQELRDALAALAAERGVSIAEQQALSLAIDGKSADVIGKELKITPDAVRKRLGEVYAKFNIPGRGTGKLAKVQQLLMSEYQTRQALPARSALPAATPLSPPAGKVKMTSDIYVERPPIESLCCETILQPGALIRIKAPQKMGKTLLLAKTLQCAEDNGCKIVLINLLQANESMFADVDTFARWFCKNVGRQLGLPKDLDSFWDKDMGSNDNCTYYFEKYVFKETDRPVTLGLDNLEQIFDREEIAQDFLGMLRVWHEDAKTRPNWQNLRLILVHSTEVYIPLDINRSPFNVGEPVELPEFNLDQVKEFAGGSGLTLSEKEVKQLMDQVGGHPYLLKLAFSHRKFHPDITLEEFLQIAHTEASPYSDHLREHWLTLENDSGLVEAMKKVVEADKPVRLEPVEAYKLHSMGLVRMQGNDVEPRCNLYRLYFRERLKNEHTA
jgi:DNA-binding CsgD family transcriptional regulator